MEVELDLTEAESLAWLGLVTLFILALLGVVGKSVSPRDGQGNPMLLTPARWQAVRLERRIAGETQRLREDADSLGRLLENPNPVDATLLAERIYSHHRSGTAATAGARQALIDAAEAAVLYASGSGSRNEAVRAYRNAVNLIAGLERRSGIRRNVPRTVGAGTGTAPKGGAEDCGACKDIGVRSHPRCA